MERGFQAVEFGVEVGEYQGVVRVPRRVFQRLLLPGQFGEYMFTASFTARDPTADPQPTTATASGPWGCWRPGLEIPLTLLVRTDEVMELEINSARSIDEFVAERGRDRIDPATTAKAYGPPRQTITAEARLSFAPAEGVNWHAACLYL